MDKFQVIAIVTLAIFVVLEIIIPLVVGICVYTKTDFTKKTTDNNTANILFPVIASAVLTSSLSILVLIIVGANLAEVSSMAETILAWGLVANFPYFISWVTAFVIIITSTRRYDSEFV